MKKLIQGIVDFRSNLTEEKRHLFSQLALGQKPDSLFIACSDSRVVPNLFASTNPGDLFVLRNIGNLVPPYNSSAEEHCAPAVIEFSIHSLNVSDIIVCGHSECGAIQALTRGVEHLECSHLQCWLKYAEGSLKRPPLNPNLSHENQISQANVLEQIDHLKTYPFIQQRLAAANLRIHGWWFDIANADVYCYEKDLCQFVLIDQNEADAILNRL